MLLRILMASVTCLHYNMQEEDVIMHIDAKCDLCSRGMHLVTLLKKLMPRY